MGEGGTDMVRKEQSGRVIQDDWVGEDEERNDALFKESPLAPAPLTITKKPALPREASASMHIE